MRKWIGWAAVLLGVLWLAGCSSSPTKPDEKPTGGGTAATGGGTPPPAKGQPAGPEITSEAKKAFAGAVATYQLQRQSGNFDYKDLIARFESVLKEDPKAAEAYYNLGCIYEAMRDDKTAQEQYRKALEVNPKLTLAAANWGAMMARHGKLDEALAMFNRALSEDSKNSAVLLNMAQIYKQQKQFDQALEKASQVLVKDPTNIGAYRIMAAVYYDRGDLDMAQLICMRGLAVKEKDPRLLNTFGLVLLKLKKAPEALAKFRQALDGEPDMIPTRFNVAKIALDYKDFRVARDEFKKIMEYDPSNRKAEIGFGIALRGNGEYDAAKGHFMSLAEKYKDDPLPYYWLAIMALRNFNNPADAIKECEQYKKMVSDDRCEKILADAKGDINRDKKMKEMEVKAEEDAKHQQDLLAKLEKERTEVIEREWAKAEEDSEPLPPKKATGAEVPFVVVPLAVLPDRDYKVKLIGTPFKDVVKVEIGTLKVKFTQIDDTTLELDVGKGREVGPWDIMVTFKEKGKDPLLFTGGLWVAEKPSLPSEKHKARIDKARAEILDKAWSEAQQNNEPLPPTKYVPTEIPFVPVPLAVISDKPVKVRLQGALFRNIARVDFGKTKAKFTVPDENNLEFEVPKGTKAGNYDISVQYKDKAMKPMVLKDGLVVVEKSKTPPSAKEQKPGGAVEQKAPPGDQPPKEQAGQPAEGQSGQPAAKPEEGTGKKDEPAEAPEPSEPKP